MSIIFRMSVGGSIDFEWDERIEESLDMPAEIDFSNSFPNPYVGKVRRRITINLDAETVDYFKAESARTGIPYQTIINMYLTECREQDKHLVFA